MSCTVPNRVHQYFPFQHFPGPFRGEFRVAGHRADMEAVELQPRGDLITR